ncbi:MAG: hypothetical protein AAF267_22315 [Deinococcota bacterium]
MAIVMGAVASVVSALIWGGIGLATGYQIGYVAVLVGFLVGFAVRYFGKGIDPVFGFVGAGFALLGCFLGNIGAVYGMMAQDDEARQFMSLLGITAWDIYRSTFNIMDIVFYGLATYFGYKFSFRR